MNNLSYGYPPSNNSSFSSFSSQYASTPSNNTRFQRPRFPYAGPPSYPRPRSSASKPNPDSYSENFQNSSYDSSMVSNDSYRNDAKGPISDYSRGYMDSMENNYGDSTLPMNNSLTMNRSQDSFNDSRMSSNSSAYFTCNESFYPSPQKLPNTSLNQQNDNLGLSNRGGFSSYSDSDFSKRTNTYFNLNRGGLAGFDQGTGLSGVGSFGRGRGTFGANNKGSNIRGQAGNFGKNRGGNARGRGRGGFQKKKTFSQGNNPSYNPSMASQCKWRCELCSIDFTSIIPYEMHLRGAKHLKKIKSQTAVCTLQNQISQVVKEIEKPDGKKYYCEACGVITNSSLQLEMHLNGTKHKAKVEGQQEPKQGPKEIPENPNKVKLGKRTSILNKEDKSSNAQENANGGGITRAAPAEFGEPQPSKMGKFSCDVCSIVVNSNIQLQQHLTSKKHQAKVEGKPIIKKRKSFKLDGDSQEPMNQDESQEPMNQDETSSEATKKEVTNVVGVKTLSASFVHGETLK